MTESGHFRVGEPARGRQVLEPTPQAAAATLEDFKTPPGIARGELKKRLDDAGINTSGIT